MACYCDLTSPSPTATGVYTSLSPMNKLHFKNITRQPKHRISTTFNIYHIMDMYMPILIPPHKTTHNVAFKLLLMTSKCKEQIDSNIRKQFAIYNLR